MHCKIDFLKIDTRGRFGQLISGFTKREKSTSLRLERESNSRLCLVPEREAHTKPLRQLDLIQFLRGKLDYIIIRVARTNGQRDVPKQHTQCNTFVLNYFCFVLGGNFISLKIQT